ncbi:gliding motility-associated C-terminal domain-containing protein [Mucilaginibacter sp.]|uniref:T9SS type B sorting domain-containing protein n=1 Tax=Mucilaginibacter sp. TaxID=1882438 RepID=UPI002612676D|nr:gliding motility-associated C-terminal domain-containing protein [Mucilaginibacter sp.]MDB4925206.1 Gliding motility-associated C-terminal protein [Mucilaginibacter sp.]
MNFTVTRNKPSYITNCLLCIVTVLFLFFFSYKVNAQATPTITITGFLAALNTVYGTPSTSAVFKVSGTNLTAGILVTPPPGFEVSINNITFSNTITIPVGAAGTVAPIQIFVRLKLTTAAGNYSGNVVLSSAGAANANVPTAISTVARAQLNISVTNKTKTYGISLLSTAASTGFTSSGLKNSESIGSVTITYGPGDLATAPVGTYTSAVVASAATGGTFIAGNYNINCFAADIIVTPAPLTIKADNQSRPFAAINPLLTVTYSGFVNNEGAAQLASQPMVNTAAGSTSLPGNYPITVNNAASANYTFNYVAGILTITPIVQQINIPNTFTPNGDGINDTWDINYLSSSYPHCTVEVLNRYGEKVYFSNGYTISWDGRYKNANLPVGTYYYLINIGSGNKPISGYVTIIR